MKSSTSQTRTRIARLASCLGLACLATAAQAQESRLNLIGAFREAFSAGPVTGTRSARTVETLVGVRIGDPDTLFEPANLRVALGQAGTQGPLCLRLIARDGRYSASATYQTAAARGAPHVDAPTRYGDALKAYRATDVAVAAFVAAGCDLSKTSELFAVLHNAPSRDDALVVQVNSSASRVRAQLARQDRPPGAPVTCAPASGGARVGYSVECRFGALEDAQPGLFSLSIIETNGSGSVQSRTYPLRLIKAGT